VKSQVPIGFRHKLKTTAVKSFHCKFFSETRSMLTDDALTELAFMVAGDTLSGHGLPVADMFTSLWCTTIVWAFAGVKKPAGVNPGGR
jgi:hypothetical protein